MISAVGPVRTLVIFGEEPAMYVPEGYGTVFPYMIVDRVEELLEFLMKTFEKALSFGATKVFEPADMAYQDRQAGVVDTCGNYWWISKRLVEEPYD